MSLVICIFLPFRRRVAKTVPKVTVHHFTYGQSIYACPASNISSTVLHSAVSSQITTKLQGLGFSLGQR